VPINGCRRMVLFPMQRLRVCAAACAVAVAGLAGCTDALRTDPHGTGGAMATGGRSGAGGAAALGGVSGAGDAPVGGSSAGGSPGSAGGASGATSGTDPCGQLDYDPCVANCLEEYPLIDNATCSNGAWRCRSGYVLASSCPALACGVTPGACCDRTTGFVTRNACAASGYRAPCPDGSVATQDVPEAYCVPDALAGVTCHSLDGQPCTGPAEGCSDTSSGFVTCACSRSGSDASAGTWYCSYFIGP
jgi:hypothetical protein